MAAMKKIHREVAELVQALDSTFAGQVILADEPLNTHDRLKDVAILQFAIKPNDGTSSSLNCLLYQCIILYRNYVATWKASKVIM